MASRRYVISYSNVLQHGCQLVASKLRTPSTLHQLENSLFHFLDPASCKSSLPMTGPTPEHDIPSDFTSQLSEKLKLQKPCESGSFGEIHRCIISTSEGTKEVAVKVFKIDPGRSEEKYQKAIHRELEVWLRLSKHPTIVPLLGIAYVESPLPALISQWMPSGTLHMYLEQGTITGSAKVELVMGVADGLKYLHSENVVHGDLHPIAQGIHVS
ncbi:kinase-like domain-containing protein [Suillus lakei]|nr:kinase-like domain-containing protein [Suillus lakei]